MMSPPVVAIGGPAIEGEMRLAAVSDMYRPPLSPAQAPDQPPLGGDPKDPLNIHFDPEWERRPARPGLPFDEMSGDSRLNDVFFVDVQSGWAVGDRGVIWHTGNGGQSWTIQKTPIRCTLRSVHFVSPSIGMAVGGFLYPYTGQGRGIVLITTDGGGTWSLLPPGMLPFLHRVKMFDPMKGILAGETSESCPSGLFTTVDGGRNWIPVSGDKSEGWISIDFLDAKNGIGIGRQGRLQATQSDKPIQAPATGNLQLAQIKMVPGENPAGKINGWLVGDGGLIMNTTDQGSRWSAAAGGLPGKAASLVDLKTIEAHGSKLWVAGNPGTFIYTSGDLGKTWKGAATGVTTPIRKIVFVDEQHGWAVGELGTILSSKDGGASWTVQRAGAKRLAALGLFARAEEIPVEAFIHICANQGYLGGVNLLFQEQGGKHESVESPRLHRIHEALLRSGACGVWELGPFSLERAELRTTLEQLSDKLQKENDGKGLERLRERLVLALRQWMPDILLASSIGESRDPVRELALREIMEAVKMAGDPTAFPYHTTELGLKPWQVKKVHLALDDGLLGDVNLATTEPLVRLGRSIDEMAYPSHGMIHLDWKNKPAIMGFSTHLDANVAGGNKDFFAGLDVPFEEARRPFLGSYATRWEEVRRRCQQRRNALGIIRHMSQVAETNGRSRSDVRLASNAAELTRKIDAETAAQILLDMGRQYHALGDWESAWEAYDMMVKQHPNHPLTRQAFLWLLRYYAGAETAWRHREDHAWKQSLSGANVTMTQSGAAADRQRLETFLDRAIALGRYLEQEFPDLADDARIRFAWASALRRRGWGLEAAQYYRFRSDMKYDDVWSMRARAEYWLSIPDKEELSPEKRELPIPAMICSFTPNKPLLDGQFDDLFDKGSWFAGKPYSLTPEKPRHRLRELLKDRKELPGLKREEQARRDSKTLGTQVMFLYDREYLYIGLRCKRAAGFSYPPIAEKPRVRDAALDGQDRVEILLDVDRDYGIYYSLTVDSRGWAVDACWEDRSWNPDWFVARHEDKDYWYIEAAIPLASLSDMVPMSQTVWAVAVRRLVPGVGIECWNAENSMNLTEGFGFLVFE